MTTPGDMCSCEIISVASPDGEIVLMRLVGEIDLHSMPVLQDALARVRLLAPHRLVVDVAELRFCSSRGLALLMEACAGVVQQGAGYHLCGLSASVGRLMSVLWPEVAAEVAAEAVTAGEAAVATV